MEVTTGIGEFQALSDLFLVIASYLSITTHHQVG